MRDDVISQCKKVCWDWKTWVVTARWSVVHGWIKRPPRPAIKTKVSARRLPLKKSKKREKRNGSADDNGDDELIFPLELN